MNTLRIFPDAAWPEAGLVCPWALVSGQRVLSEGQTTPEHWPAADETELVLASADATWLRPNLPPGAVRNQVLAFACEEALASETESLHFAAGAGKGEGPVDVVVVSRQRLAGLLQFLAGLDRTPVRAWLDVHLLPALPGQWSLLPMPSGGSARLGLDTGITMDQAQAESPPLSLRLAMDDARSKGYPPRQLAFAGVIPPWAAGLGPACMPLDSRWRAGQPEPAVDLLSGEFTPANRRHGGWRSLRPALALAASACLLELLVTLTAWGLTAREAADLRAESTAVAHRALPGEPLLDPARQLARALDGERRRHGLASHGDFLPLLAAVAMANPAPASLRRADYASGRLSIELAGDGIPLARRFAAAGLDARTQAAANGVTRIVLTAAGS